MRLVGSLALAATALLGVAAPAPASSNPGAVALARCVERIAFGLGDPEVVRGSVPDEHDLLRGLDGRPVLLVNAIKCDAATVDGVTRATTVSLLAAVVHSPDGAGCTSRVPAVGLVHGDVLPLCNLFVLHSLYDNPDLVRWYHDGVSDYPASYVPDLDLSQRSVGPLGRFSFRALQVAWDGYFVEVDGPTVPLRVALWWSGDSTRPHAVVEVNFHRLAICHGTVRAVAGGDWSRYFGGDRLVPLTGPGATSPCGTWSGQVVRTIAP